MNSTPNVCERYHLAKMAGTLSNIKKVRKNMKLPDIFDFLRDHKCITNHHVLERNVGDPLWSSIYASPFTPELGKDG